jgi:hypothetical protein
VGSPDVLQGFVRCCYLSDAGLHVCICPPLKVYHSPKVREGLDLLQVVVSQLHSLCAGGVDFQYLGLVRMDVKTDLGGVGGQVCGLVLHLLPIVGEQSEVVGEV